MNTSVCLIGALKSCTFQVPCVSSSHGWILDSRACPYALTPRNCGHTFCATCILKWFFSRLHKGCGGWHEAVDCPLCRSALPHTPERTPRSTSCFPFTPNRTAETAIRGLINTISHELTSTSTLASHPLSDWEEGGYSKREWSKRERCVTSSDLVLHFFWLIRPFCVSFHFFVCRQDGEN